MAFLVMLGGLVAVFAVTLFINFAGALADRFDFTNSIIVNLGIQILLWENSWTMGKRVVLFILGIILMIALQHCFFIARLFGTLSAMALAGYVAFVLLDYNTFALRLGVTIISVIIVAYTNLSWWCNSANRI